MCERGLAEAYRRLADCCDAEEALTFNEFAIACERSADLLRARVFELGGTPDAGIDDAWLLSESLADAERHALATYHDHVGDHDLVTQALIRDQILPRHRAAVEYLLRDSPVARDSEI
jgi:hypothetical protein